MLQQPYPGDYIIATGESHSIKEFLEIAFNYAGLDNW
jgi:GDPmannose 4,6-dehydratase